MLLDAAVATSDRNRVLAGSHGARNVQAAISRARAGHAACTGGSAGGALASELLLLAAGSRCKRDDGARVGGSPRNAIGGVIMKWPSLAAHR